MPYSSAEFTLRRPTTTLVGYGLVDDPQVRTRLWQSTKPFRCFECQTVYDPGVVHTKRYTAAHASRRVCRDCRPWEACK